MKCYLNTHNKKEFTAKIIISIIFIFIYQLIKKKINLDFIRILTKEAFTFGNLNNIFLNIIKYIKKNSDNTYKMFVFYALLIPFRVYCFNKVISVNQPKYSQRFICSCLVGKCFLEAILNRFEQVSFFLIFFLNI